MKANYLVINPDGLHPKLFYELRFLIASHLTKLFKLYFAMEDWKIANVTLV